MRTAIYIDGFNFYYGAVKDTAYKWLDPKLLCKTILKSSNDIIAITYCTAKVKSRVNDPYAPARQSAYLKAIKFYIPELKIIYGYFQMSIVLRKPVNPTYRDSIKVFDTEEKGSDVNLAVHLVNDAHKDKFDCAVVISTDSDLAEAMRIVKEEHNKIVGLFTPWKRHMSGKLMTHSNFQRTIRESTLARCQLPNPIPGTNIYKPREW